MRFLLNTFFFTAGLLCATTKVLAQEVPPRNYAVMSLVGDSISAVSFGSTTGSRIDTNGKKVIAIPDTVFDEAAIRCANAAILKLQPAVKTTLMLTQDRGLYAAQNEMFESAGANKDNRDFLKNLLKNRGATHLVLITKWRSDAELRLAHTTIGSGRLEGLGFYMNGDVEVTNTETLNNGQGVLAPFAYVRVRLIDANTLDVIAESTQKQSHVVGNYDRGSTGLSAWNALTSKQKVDYLDTLIAAAMADAIPRLMVK